MSIFRRGCARIIIWCLAPKTSNRYFIKAIAPSQKLGTRSGSVSVKMQQATERFGILCLVALFTVFVQLATCAHNLEEEYRSSAILDDGYTLHWNFDLEQQTIAFAVNVSTTGWVGFGLSPNGQMPQSDVVIGWVDNDGNTQFHVR